MNKMTFGLGLALFGLAAVPVRAETPGASLEHVAARVVVIPEARGNVSVSIRQGDPRLPAVTAHARGATLVVQGGLDGRISGCDDVGLHLNLGWSDGGGHEGAAPGLDVRAVRIRGVGAVPLSRLPLITVRTPLNSRVAASGAVWGQVGDASSLSLSSAACGLWTLDQVQGLLDLDLSGSSDVRGAGSGPLRVRSAGSSDVVVGPVQGAADLSLSGSGGVRTGPVAGGLHADTAASGDVVVSRVQGPIQTSILGSGEVEVRGGNAPGAVVNVVGSGDFKFGGVAGNLAASVSGSGDVHVAHVTGRVSKSVSGSGEITAN